MDSWLTATVLFSLISGGYVFTWLVERHICERMNKLQETVYHLQYNELVHMQDQINRADLRADRSENEEAIYRSTRK